MATLIKGASIVNEGRCFDGSIVIDGEKIVDIIEGDAIVNCQLSIPSTLPAAMCCPASLIPTYISANPA